MELTDYIRILRKNWLIIVIATLLGVGTAAAYSLTREPQYEASSTVFVSTQSGFSVSELQQGANFTQSRMTTYAELVTKPIVTNPVIAELGLGVTSDSLSSKVAASNPLNTQLRACRRRSSRSRTPPAPRRVRCASRASKTPSRRSAPRAPTCR